MDNNKKVVLSKQTWSPEARPVTKSDRWDWRREDQTASSLERLAYQVFLYKCNVATAYLYCSNGSRLCLRVPEKSTGSYAVGETISWQFTDFFGQIVTPDFLIWSVEKPVVWWWVYSSVCADPTLRCQLRRSISDQKRALSTWQSKVANKSDIGQ